MQGQISKINTLRKKIDLIDKKIRETIDQRAKLVVEIGELKRGEKRVIIDKCREKEIMAKLETKYEKNIFKAILSESRKLQ